MRFQKTNFWHFQISIFYRRNSQIIYFLQFDLNHTFFLQNLKRTLNNGQSKNQSNPAV